MAIRVGGTGPRVGVPIPPSEDTAEPGPGSSTQLRPSEPKVSILRRRDVDATSQGTVLTPSAVAPVVSAPHPTPKLSLVKKEVTAARPPANSAVGEPPELTPDLIAAVARGSEPLLLAFVRPDVVDAAIREQLAGLRERVQAQRRRLLAIAGDGNNVAAQDASAVLSEPFFASLAGDGFDAAARALIGDWQKSRRGALLTYARRLVVADQLTLTKQQMVREHARTLGLDGAHVEHIRAVLEKEGVTLEHALPLVDRAHVTIRSVEDITRLAETHLLLVMGDLETAISGNALRFWLREVAAPPHLVEAQVQAVKRVQNVLADGRLSAAAREQLLKQTLHRSVWDVIWAAGYHFLELGDLSRDGARVRLSSLEQLTRLLDGRFCGESVDGGALDESKHPTGFEALEPAITAQRLSGWLRHLCADASSIEAAEDLERELPAKGKSAVVVRLAFHRLAWSRGLRWLAVTGLDRIEGRASVVALNPNAKAAMTAMKDGLLDAYVREALGQAQVADGARAAAQGVSDAVALRVLQWKLGRRSVSFDKISISEPVLESLVEAATKSEAALEKFGDAIIEDIIPRWLEHTDGPLSAQAPAIRQRITRNAPIDTALRVLRHLGMDSYPVFPTDRPKEGPVGRLAGRGDLCARAPALRAHLDVEARLASLQEFFAPAFRGPKPDGLLDVLWRAGDSTLRDSECQPVTPRDGPKVGGLDVSAEEARQAFVSWLDGQPRVPPQVQNAAESGALSRWLAFHDRPRAEGLAERLKAPGAKTRKLEVILAAFGYSRLVVNPNLAVSSVAELVAHGAGCLTDIERLLDSGQLESWVDSSEARRRLLLLRTRTDEAAVALARAKTQKQPAWCSYGAGADMRPMATHPEQWLLLRNRAALALIALGARAPTCRIAASGVGGPTPCFDAKDMEPDVDLDVAIPLVDEPGDVPLVALVLDEQGVPTGPPWIIGDGKPTYFVPAAGISAGTARLDGTVVVPVFWADGPAVERHGFSMSVRTAFPAGRLAAALKRGAAQALLGAFFGALAGGALYVAWLPLESWADAGHQGMGRIRLFFAIAPVVGVIAALLALALGYPKPEPAKPKPGSPTNPAGGIGTAMRPGLGAMLWVVGFALAESISNVVLGLSTIAGWFPGYTDQPLGRSVLIGLVVAGSIAGGFIGLGRTLARSRFLSLAIATELAGALLLGGLLA